MTQNQKTTESPGMSRAELIEELSNAVKIIGGKVTAQRVRPKDSDETRLKYARALAQLATPLLSAMRDEQLDDIERRLSTLEERGGP